MAHANGNWALYKRLLGYSRPQLPLFVLSLVAMVIAAATEPALAYLMKPLVDIGFVDSSQTARYLLPSALVGLFVVRGLAGYANEYLTSKLGMNMVTHVREEIFRKLVQLPTTYFGINSSGRMSSRISHDVEQIAQATFNVITVTVKDSIILIGLLIQLFWLDAQLTLICLTVFPVVSVVISSISKRIRKLAEKNHELTGSLVQHVNEAVLGNKVIKLHGAQTFASEHFSHVVKALARTNVKKTAASAANTAITQFLIAIALALVIYIAIGQAQNHGMSAGTFVAFMTSMLLLLPSVKRITSITLTLQRGLAAASSVFAFLDEPVEADDGREILGKSIGWLSFEDVSLTYKGAEKPALDGVSLTIPAGKTVALVGSSGSGKSTLVNLVPRFHVPDSGHIRIGGKELSDISMASLREHIAMVSQDVVLFNDSVAANIAYGKENIGEAALIAAAEAANALEFILALPQGFATTIGENGALLSGGQRQRLAIARAVLKDAPILILDEATSALDTQSERLVQEALEKLMQGRTTLVIAHRLSTVESADLIVVMQHGRIVEQGTHAELLARNGVYAGLHNMQFRETNT